MANYTENYNLKKPDRTDFYSVQDFNDNADIIDAALDDKLNKDFSNVSSGAIPIANGGTGATTAADALSNLGITTALDNKADKDLSNVTVTLPITKGGTGATTAANALSNLGAVPLTGGTLSGRLAIEYNYTDEASFTVTNPNGSVQLSVNNSRGIYDKGNSKWVLQSSSGSSDWTFHGTATNAQMINNQTVNLVYTQSSQPSSAADGSLWAW